MKAVVLQKRGKEKEALSAYTAIEEAKYDLLFVTF